MQKKRHPILGILVLLIGICLIAAALNGGDGPKKVPDDASGSTSSSEDTPQTTFSVGDKVVLDDITVTFVSCSENSGSQFIRPDDGNVFVVCEFEIENDSKNDIAVSSIVSFSAYCDDYSTNLSIGAMTSVDKQNQLDGSVAAGKKMHGVIGYEVPKDWTELEIQFTPDFWAGKDIIFIATH